MTSPPENDTPVQCAEKLTDVLACLDRLAPASQEHSNTLALAAAYVQQAIDLIHRL